MKTIIFLALMMLSYHAFAQSDFERLTDKETGNPLFKGRITFADIEKEPAFTWLKKGAEGYKPDSVAVASLRQMLPQYEIVVVLGTWCEDSHLLIPKLYKTLQAANYPMAQLSMYGVDRAKQSNNYEHQTYRIDKVPAVILYQHHQEQGRIVESVKESIEADLLRIIDKN